MLLHGKTRDRSKLCASLSLEKERRTYPRSFRTSDIQNHRLLLVEPVDFDFETSENPAESCATPPARLVGSIRLRRLGREGSIWRGEGREGIGELRRRRGVVICVERLM